MPYWRLFYHFTWSTKYRLPLIDPVFEPELYNVILAKTKSLGGIPYAVGGIEDHIHLAASIPPNIALGSFVGQVKGNSAYFINHKFCPNEPFAWQEEYGVHSFGAAGLDQVVKYIKNQREHHANNSLILAWERETADPRK